MKATAQQEAFLNALLSTDNHLALVARAGCGKTSTILLGVDAIVKANPTAEIAVCAYNKAIADEVSEKLKTAGHTNWKTVQASTLHSMGFGLLKFVFKSTVDDKKVANLIKAHNEDVFFNYVAQITSLVRYAKQAGVGFFTDKQIGDASVWYALADHFDIDGFEDTSDMDIIVEAAQIIYKESLAQTDVVDFDDMILFPLVKNLRVKFGKDFLFLDEAQDLSPSRQALARKFLKIRGGRMIIVGDDRQAIYGFSGADSQALPNMIKALNATTLPLSVTFRCPTSVVARAQMLVSDIQAAPGAKVGSVTVAKELPADINNKDAILCRNTAPLITLAYSLIRQGKACKVEGRSIGEGLLFLVKRWKITTISALLNKLDDYQDRETQKAQAKGNDAKVEEIADRVETIREICKACIAQDKRFVSDVVDFVNNLFADDAKNVTILATYHRSKGREWQRVILWEHSTRCPSKRAKQEWQLAQEANLAYVAITRAQRDLIFVEK